MLTRSTVLALTAMQAVFAVTLAAEGDLPEVGEQVAILQDKRITESSGLAIGLRDRSIFWTLNDSGGEPCIFAVDHSGKTRAKVRVRDAANFDWEDLVTGYDAGEKPCVFIGDIGDNFHLRPSIQVYQIEEPDLPPVADADKELETPKPAVWHLTYPDGPKNAESLLFHPITRRLYVLSKSEDGLSALYMAPERLQENKAMVMEKVCDLVFEPIVRVGKRPKDASQTTAACFSPDGRRVLVATYSFVFEWLVNDDETIGAALARPSKRIKPPLLSQIEGACYGEDGLTIWLTSERLPAPLVRIQRRE